LATLLLYVDCIGEGRVKLEIPVLFDEKLELNFGI
jgi:hypothetical protein